MSSGYSREDYSDWETFPVLVGTLIPLFFYLFFVGACFFIARTQRSGKIESLFYGFGKMAFRGSLKREDDPSGDKNYFLFGCKFSKYITLCVAVISVSLWSPVFTAFWSAFLIQESFSCAENIDCFIEKSRISNCSALVSEGASEVICYTFVLNYILGLGAAGGVFVIVTSIIEIYMEFLILIFKKLVEGNEEEAQRYSCFLAVVFGLIPIPFAALIPSLYAVPSLQTIVFPTFPKILKLISFVVFLLVCLIMAAVSLRFIEVEENEERIKERRSLLWYKPPKKRNRKK